MSRGTSTSRQQVVLAWERALDEHVIPISGARRPASIIDSAQAADLGRTTDEISEVSRSVGIHD